MDIDEVSLLDRVCAWLLASWPSGEIGGLIKFFLRVRFRWWLRALFAIHLHGLKYKDVWVRIYLQQFRKDVIFEVSLYLVCHQCVSVSNFCTWNTSTPTFPNNQLTDQNCT